MVFWVQRKAVAIELDWHFRLIPSRERKRATSFHRPQGARNTKLNALVPVTSSSEAMNLVFRVQKRLVERVARLRSRLGFGLPRRGDEPGVAGSRSVLVRGSLACARGSVSDFHARALNPVFRVQKRLGARVARFRSRLGIGLSRQGAEPGVPGPKASWCEGRSLALAARFRTYRPRH